MLRALFHRLTRPAPITPQAARLRVARGAALLDAAEPDWTNRLDPERLELSDGSHCVLGQLHGAFQIGLLRAGVWDASSAGGGGLLSRTSPVDLGFYARTDVEGVLADLDYSYLNVAWREAIAERIGACTSFAAYADSRRLAHGSAAAPEATPRATTPGARG